MMLVMKMILMGYPSIPLTNYKRSNSQDPDLSKLIHWLEADEEPLINDLYLCSPAVKRFWLQPGPNLRYKMGFFYYKWEDSPAKLLLIVPTAIREKVLQGCHYCPTAGHLGQRKTLARVKRSFIWHDMQHDIVEYVHTCSTYSKNMKANVKPKAGLGCFHAGIHMECVHMDMLGPFPPSVWGNKYILVMVDQFS